VLTAARLDVCVLANNHAGDFGYRGLAQTVEVLHRRGLRTAGAGHTLDEARAPAVVELAGGRRLLVYALATASSGAPRAWLATDVRAGIDVVDEPDDATAKRLIARIGGERRPGDVVVVSLHWGGNWGWDVPAAHVKLAHRLIDSGAVDVVFGHSSHHPRPVEVYRQKLILYGAGDLIDDYEGIGGDAEAEYRSDLGLLWLPTVAAGDGHLERLRMVPVRMRHFRLERVPAADVRWLRDTLERVSARFGAHVETSGDELRLRWR
jgi:poly-gamma-glutamate capsule biosynthesis protein CapA/YwtB (metallophosphatase superfamily)